MAELDATIRRLVETARQPLEPHQVADVQVMLEILITAKIDRWRLPW
jgi:hypothetical protein